MKKTIIGLVGVKTSGKTTTSKIIKDMIKERNVKESALADKLKISCSKTFGVPKEYFDDQDLKEVPFINGPKELTNSAIGTILEYFDIYMSKREIDSLYNVIGMKLDTPRKIAQIVGTEVLRIAGGQDIHCENIEMGDDITIVSDVRFQNEFEYFMKNSIFLPIYIQRDIAENKITQNSHSSERSIFSFCSKCFQINNNNNLEDLEYQIQSLLLQTGFITDVPKQA